MLLMQHSEDDTRDKRTTGTEKKQDRDDKDPRWGLRALYEPTECVQLNLECFATLQNICIVRRAW